MSVSLRKFSRRLALVLATLMVLCGLLLGAFQLAFSRVPAYRVQLQHFLQERTGLAIEFRELSARLRAHGPELVFNELVVRTPDRSRVLATARRGSVGFDLWRSVSAWQLTSGQFTLQSPQIGLIRTTDGRIQLVGQSALPERDMPFELEQLPVGGFVVRDAIVSFRDEATGRGPWALSGVSFTLDRRRELLDLRGTAALPATLGKSLTFTARVHGTLGKTETLFSSVTVAGDNIDLAGWADMLPDGWPAPDSGHGSVHLSAAFRGPALGHVAANVDLHNVTAVAPVWAIPLPRPQPLIIPEVAAATPSAAEKQARSAGQAAVPAPPHEELLSGDLLSYRRVAFGLRAQRREQGWELSFTDLDLSRTDVPWHSKEVHAGWTRGEAGAFELTGKADRVVLDNVWPLLAYLPESTAAAHIRALQGRGVVNDLAFDIKRPGAGVPLQYTVTAALQKVAVKPVLNAPGINALSGSLRASDARGEFVLDARDLQFELPGMFRAPLPIRSLTGALAWQREDTSWRLASDNLELDSVDGQASVALSLALPDDGSSPVMDMRARARNLDATATSKYLPASRLTVRTLQWLDQAFASGRVIDSEIVLKGPLRAFPFRKREGQFVARAKVADITFQYQNGWLPARQLSAEVEFRNQGMTAHAINAKVGELKVRNAQGALPDFHRGEISIETEASGDFGQTLAVLRNSPIGPALGPLFARLRGSGPTSSKLSLWLPLQHMNDRRISVTTQLVDATAELDGIDAPLTSLTGSLTVQQTLLSGAELEGRLLGGPVSIRIAQNSADTATLSANGHALASHLIPFLPAVVKVSGATDWQAGTRIRTGQADQSKQSQRWQVAATMDGLGVLMPYPVGKPQQGARPLHADLEFDEAILARASYGDMRALLRVQQAGGRWTFDRAGVRADGIAAALPAHRGLRVEGDIDRIELDDWFDLRGSPADSAAGHSSKLSDILQAANVRVGRLHLFGFTWSDVRGVLQANNGGWRLDVAGPQSAGQMQIPASLTGNEPLTATMDRLSLQPRASEPVASPETPRDPRAWPSMRIHIADLQVADHPLGTLDLKATRVANGLQIDSADIAQPAAQGEASGQWLMTPDGERSNLRLQIASTDVGATLRTLNYTPFMEARRGEVKADLAWNGGFSGNFLAKSSGSLTVAAETGQVSSLHPGAGRVLGLFSVAALPRRLALDFSDLTEKGLGFDTVHGDFDMREGNAYTSNLTLRGPAAEIGIAGRTGLGTHDYDQTAVVTGNLGASLPVAGVLAGGPAVGAALLLFSQVFKEPLKGMTRGYYRITGSWEEPVVERVEAAEIKQAGASARLVR